ncbi:MAG: ribonuclease HII [Lachnospiraceae bacterium]|nr:ribonuclease HII [Lachnospiraceae bacterium]
MTKQERLEKEIKRTEEVRAFDKEFVDKYDLVCGIDEVGRGPLAGPVVTAAVILPKDCDILYINDSKKLSEKKRKEVSEQILEKAVAVGFGISNEETIDKVNILNATKMAMREAVNNLNPKANFALVDAVHIEDLGIEQASFVKGDAKSMSIAAASIVAKVKRDEFMVEMDKKYPEYGFASNKGYGTKAHMDAVREYGPCPIHRLTFLKFLNE